MGGTEGKRESPVTSLRGKPDDDFRPYRFRLVKKLIDLIFRRSTPKN